MNDLVHPAGAARQPRAPHWARRSVLTLLAVYAVVVLAIMIVAGMPRDLPEFAGILVFFAWALAPIVAVCLFVYQSRDVGIAISAALITPLAVVSGIYIYLDAMFGPAARSTSPLIFLFLPLYQWSLSILLLCTEGVVALTNVLWKRDRP